MAAVVRVVAVAVAGAMEVSVVVFDDGDSEGGGCGGEGGHGGCGWWRQL